MCKQQSSGDQCGKNSVDRSCIEHHRCPKLLGISNHPYFIPVNGVFKLLKGKDRLAKGFYHRNPTDILYRFIGHIIQRILVFFHLFLHLLSGHCHHDQKSQHNRNKAQQSQSPVKCEQQHQKTTGGCNGIGSVGKLMSEIGFGGCTGFVDDFAQFSAAKTLGKPKRQLNNMLHGLDTQVCGNTKCSQMGTHQPCYVDKHRYNRKQYCHPAITGQVLCLVKIRCHLQYFLDHFPDVIEWYQSNQGTDRRKHPGSIGQVLMAACNFQQA